MTKSELIKLLDEFEDDDVLIVDLWYKSDVVNNLAEHQLTDEEYIEVVKQVEDALDANYGINWETIRQAAEETVKRRQS